MDDVRDGRRLFFGLSLERHFKTVLTRYRDIHGKIPYLRWTPVRNYHITTLFIGSVAPEFALPLSAVAEEVASITEPFTLTLSKVGYAPPNERASMVWAYFSPTPEFVSFVERLRTDVRTVVDPQDSFKTRRDVIAPHVTLARFVPGPFPRELYELRRSGLETCDLYVDEMHLYSSRSLPHGTEYEVVATFSFREQG